MPLEDKPEMTAYMQIVSLGNRSGGLGSDKGWRENRNRCHWVVWCSKSLVLQFTKNSSVFKELLNRCHEITRNSAWGQQGRCLSIQWSRWPSRHQFTYTSGLHIVDHPSVPKAVPLLQVKKPMTGKGVTQTPRFHCTWTPLGELGWDWCPWLTLEEEMWLKGFHTQPKSDQVFTRKKQMVLLPPHSIFQSVLTKISCRWIFKWNLLWDSFTRTMRGAPEMLPLRSLALTACLGLRVRWMLSFSFGKT